MDGETYKGCVEGAVWQGCALTIFGREGDVWCVHLLLGDLEHNRGNVSCQKGFRLARKHLRVETSPAAELHQAPQVSFAGDSLPNHRPRLSSHLQIDHAIVPVRDV